MAENLDKTAIKKETVDDSVEALSASAKASTNTFSKLVLNIVQSSEAEQNVEQILQTFIFMKQPRKRSKQPRFHLANFDFIK